MRELLQQALEALMFKVSPRKVLKVIAAIEEELAKPEQEPVAWKEINTSFCSNNKDLCDDDEPIPLYTAPPKHEWQGLTDEDIDWVFGLAYADDMELLKTIEAKLREKNG